MTQKWVQSLTQKNTDKINSEHDGITCEITLLSSQGMEIQMCSNCNSQANTGPLEGLKVSKFN